MIQPCIFSDEVSSEFEEAVRLSAEAGARGLELRNRMFGRSITQIDDDDVARIREICRRYGVAVAVIGSPVGKCAMDRPEELAQHHVHFRRMTELAHALGSGEAPALIRAFALWRPERDRATDHIRPDLEEFLPQVRAFLEPLIAMAEQAGVRYCLETEGATLVGTCAEASRVMDVLGRPAALGLAWDVNNGAWCGENPYPDGYRHIRDRVYHVHVKPNQAGSLATVAETPLTYEQLLSTLREDGFQGWASIEHWGTPEAMLGGLRELLPVLDRVNSA
ncbi:MAG: sugar phosphate isomerase/epimerase [Armatimonadetes bacterium]|nr:sugar phosphate isomerase/epimerase [Armatimonadota bacterium]